MGSRFSTVAQVVTLVVAAAAGVASANPAKAKELFGKGLELYKAQQYEQAAETLKQSYELDPKPDALFAWAQSERLAGHCDKAIPLYRKLTDQSSDLGTAKLVHDNLARCEQAIAATQPPKEEPKDPPKEEPKPEPKPEPPPPPQIITREVKRTDPLATTLFVGGSLALGVATGMFVASVGSANASDRAATYDDHIDLSDRARTERTVAYVVGGVGIAMLGVAIFRVMSSSDEPPPPTTVTLSPGSNGAATVGLSGRW